MVFVHTWIPFKTGNPQRPRRLIFTGPTVFWQATGHGSAGRPSSNVENNGSPGGNKTPRSAETTRLVTVASLSRASPKGETHTLGKPRFANRGENASRKIRYQLVNVAVTRVRAVTLPRFARYPTCELTVSRHTNIHDITRARSWVRFFTIILNYDSWEVREREHRDGARRSVLPTHKVPGNTHTSLHEKGSKQKKKNTWNIQHYNCNVVYNAENVYHGIALTFPFRIDLTRHRVHTRTSRLPRVGERGRVGWDGRVQ